VAGGFCVGAGRHGQPQGLPYQAGSDAPQVNPQGRVMPAVPVLPASGAQNSRFSIATSFDAPRFVLHCFNRLGNLEDFR